MNHNIFHHSKKNKVKYFLDGLEYQNQYLNLIKNAKHNIHLQTYIFELDSFGSKVYDELIIAAERGISIYLLIDSVGSSLFSESAEKKLKAKGVQFLRFNGIQFKWLYRWGRRLHHKILLVDEEISFVGGINVTSSFDSKFQTYQLDFAICLQGSVILELTHYVQNVFKKSCGNKTMTFPKIPHLSSPYNHSFMKDVDVKILVNDWVFRRWQITKDYTHKTQNAKHSITILNSYFFPRRVFMRQLVEASKRGVKVRLILPKFSDWPSYILASEFLYSYFLKNGVEIYQWKQSNLHGKMAIIDHNWCTIGSFNLNYTSYQQNLEMNINLYSEEFTNTLLKEIDNLIESGCDKVDANNFIKHCPLAVRIKRFFYYIIAALVANFSIGMTYQEDDKKGNQIYNLMRIVGATLFLTLGIVGSLLPVLPGIPFFIISFLLIYKQILLNKKK